MGNIETRPSQQPNFNGRLNGNSAPKTPYVAKHMNEIRRRLDDSALTPVNRQRLVEAMKRLRQM